MHFLDYEVEIGLVIGRELPVGTQVTEENWASFVAGLVVTNDVSARDVQLPKTQFFESKSYPTFTPVGPALVLLDDDELKRFGDLRLRLWVNGELRQDAVVDADMIYSPLEALQALSRFQRLDAGRPAADRHPGGHRPERAAEAGRDHRRAAAARAEVEAVLQAPGPEPQVPQGRRRRRGRHRHRRRCHRPRPAAHRRQERVMGDLLWPAYDGPGDLAAIEAVPLADRGLPGTTYELLVRAAGLWPDRVALSVLPDGDGGSSRSERTFAELLADVHRYANVFHALGVRRGDAVALLAPNCDELITATLAAELAGIAAPINSGLSGEHIAELLRRSGARVLVAAGPDLAPEVWENARKLAVEAGIDALLALRPTGAAPAEAELLPIDGVQVAYLSALAAEQPHDRFVGEPPSAADLAALFHTGGTTGTPKLAAHTHANEVSDAWMIAAIGLLRRRVRGLRRAAALPRQRAGRHPARAAVQGPARRLGGTPGLSRHHAVRQLLEARRALPGHRDERACPTVYCRPRRSPRRRRHQQPAVRRRRRVPPAAGGPRDVRVRHRACPLVEGYGLTEATCASALQLPGPAPSPGPSASACPTSR